MQNQPQEMTTMDESSETKLRAFLLVSYQPERYIMHGQDAKTIQNYYVSI